MLQLAALLLLAAAPSDPRLVGTWALEGEPFMVLAADGSGRMDASRVRWSAQGGVLTVTAEDGSAERTRYRVSGDVLVLEQETGAATLTRVAAGGAGGPADGAGGRGTGVPPAAAGGPAPKGTAGPWPGVAPAAAPGGAPAAATAPPPGAVPARGAAASSRAAASAAPEPAGRSLPSGRAVRFNGRALDAAGLEVLARLERAVGTLADGDYWYDPRSGASGRWGGPALAFLPAGLPLGGPLPAEASGGGRGNLTGVFVNGRELHPVDVAGLQEIVGVVVPGRWWVDATGAYGLEGGPPAGNLVAMARARQGGSRAWSRHYEGVTPGGNMNLASDGATTCVSVSGYSRCTGE
jgi:hypothetical protein